MMRTLLVLGVLAVLVVQQSSAAEDKVAGSVYDFTLENIDGKPYDLAQHKGQVLLVVNVASECGYTPQYTGLQALYLKYKDKGLTVVGVPANEFGAQEPGSNAEIKTFCTAKYNVAFPMMAKTVVKGEKICPLYKYLTAQTDKPGDIAWNFNKFLVDRNGKVLARFDSKVKPQDPKLTEALEKALDEKAK